MTQPGTSRTAPQRAGTSRHRWASLVSTSFSGGSHEENGFSLIELVVVMALMTLVLGIFVGILIPLSKSASQTKAISVNQLKVRFAVLQLARDLQGGTLSPFSSATTYYDPATQSAQAQIEVFNPPSKPAVDPPPQTLQCWIYDGGGNLYRLQPASSSLTGCALPTGAIPVLSGIQATSTPILSYYDSAGNPVSPPAAMPASWGGDASFIAECAVSVHIQVTAQPDPNASPYTESLNVALRNQLPGGQSTCP